MDFSDLWSGRLKSLRRERGETLIDKIDGLIRGHKISWEKRETHFHNHDGASEAFLSRTENNRETRHAGHNGVHLRTPYIWKGFKISRYSWMEEGLLLLIGRASLSRLTNGDKMDGIDRPNNGSRRGRLAEEQSVL